MGAAKEFDPDDVAYIPTTGVSKVFETSLVPVTAESIKGYGHIVESPKDFPIEILRWPAQGWRPVDDNSGDQGGVTEGIFEFWWKGDTLFARNNAVGDNYEFGWSCFPEKASREGPANSRDKLITWKANYHPDGGQLFYPLDGQTFIVPMALPGDDVTPRDFKAFLCEGGRGLYMHPSIWNGAVVPLADHCRFLDRQGRVHARISVDFAKEYGGYLSVPLSPTKE